MTWSKTQLVERWRARLLTRVEGLERGRDSARAGTRVDGDHRPENRGERASVTTQGYLAHGLARRIAELGEALAQLDEMGTAPRRRVSVGALVKLEDEAGESSWLAIFPGGDASTLEADGATLRVLSASSPWARQLAGLEPGDSAELPQGDTQIAVELLEVL
jgi:transcription elongation GreA/GreB family factor